MSDVPESNLYNLYKNENLVTIASPIESNLALQFEDYFFSCTSLCVVHDGYINYIPIRNKSRKCKYVPVSKDGKGIGKIRQIKWLKFDPDLYFVVLSNLGLHVYDEDLTHIKFYYGFEDKCCPVGCCVINDILYVGVDNDKVYSFQHKRGNFEIFNETKCVFATFNGMKDYIVTDYFDAITLWTTNQFGAMNIVEMCKEGSLYGTTVLKIYPGYVMVGYRSGLLIILEVPNLLSLTKSMIHNDEITDFDYNDNRKLLVTASKDKTLKVYKIDDKRSKNGDFTLSCLWTMENPEDLPYCGVGYLDDDATEFCAVVADETIVQIFRQELDIRKSVLKNCYVGEDFVSARPNEKLC